MDQFTDMVKLEFLDLSGDSRIQALPSMPGATTLKILVLNGYVGLERVGPEGLPPSLESFSLDCSTRGDNNKEAKISHISLAGCARLANFRLCGSLPNLEDLDLSERHQAYAAVMDIRFLQTLVLESNVELCWKSTRFHLNLCVPCTNTVEDQSYHEKTDISSSGRIMGPPRQKSLIPDTYITYMDVFIDNMTIDHDYDIAWQFRSLGCHVEIGDGFSFTRMECTSGMKAIIFVMEKAESLHVHDNSSISTVIPRDMMSIEDEELAWQYLKCCHVVRCPKMHRVFSTSISKHYNFQGLVNFWAADLLTTHCIWSKQRASDIEEKFSFSKLQSIHLFSCPRLTFVLMMSRLYTLRSLETLHIAFCGDLRQVFPVETEILTRIATGYHQGVLEFPNLKHIYLHQLFKLQHICKAKMFAPKLETMRVRGCWGLRRLPAVGRDCHPIVDCEKGWWEKLEWDGLEVCHDPSLFQPRHSAYYKKPLPRVSVLR